MMLQGHIAKKNMLTGLWEGHPMDKKLRKKRKDEYFDAQRKEAMLLVCGFVRRCEIEYKINMAIVLMQLMKF